MIKFVSQKFLDDQFYFHYIEAFYHLRNFLGIVEENCD